MMQALGRSVPQDKLDQMVQDVSHHPLAPRASSVLLRASSVPPCSLTLDLRSSTRPLLSYAQIDTDKSGNIDFDEFCVMMGRQMKDKNAQRDLKNAFQSFDRDGNGFISAPELRHLMSTLGQKLTEEEINEMIDEADEDGDAQISFEEFQQMMML